MRGEEVGGRVEAAAHNSDQYQGPAARLRPSLSLLNAYIYTERMHVQQQALSYMYVQWIYPSGYATLLCSWPAVYMKHKGK